MNELTASTSELGRAAASYREIKRRIMNRVYEPGAKLSEVRLAAELGVGRSPIRTAFARLQSEGWIAISPQSGTYVTGLTDGEMNEVFELRLILEPAAAALAAERMTEADLGELRKAYVAIEADASATVDDYMALDLRTHRAVYKGAGNGLISTILVNLLDKVQWIQRGSADSMGRQLEAFAETKPLLAALESRDPERASTAMREHISRTARFRNLPAGVAE